MRKIDLTGQRFGRLTVLKEGEKVAEGKYGRTSWDCLCDCGNTVNVRTNVLRRGGTKSCGCLALEISKQNRLPERVTNCEICKKEIRYRAKNAPKSCSDECHKIRRKEYFNKMHETSFEYFIKRTLRNVKKRAIKKGTSFDLDYEYMVKTLDAQDWKCPKTGVKFELSLSGKKNSNKSPWSISVDQIDSGKGYTKENIQIVSCIYNMAKHTWSHKDIIRFCEATINHE